MTRPAFAACIAAATVLGGAAGIPAQEGTRRPTPPGLVFAFEARVEVGAPLEVGQLPRGMRRIVPILRGTFEGPGIKGKVMPGGADWQMIGADGFSELDTRYTLETDTGRIIYVQNVGIRHSAPDVMQRLLRGEAVDPKLVYFRTVPNSRHPPRSSSG
jgi:Protein of unknown function (DUF3237)